MKKSKILFTRQLNDSSLFYQKAESYFNNNIYDKIRDQFVCPAEKSDLCSASCCDRNLTYYQAHAHYIEKNYGLSLNGKSLRVMVVGQEYGPGPSFVTPTARSEKILESAQLSFFGTQKSSRNPHMRGTTLALRYLLLGNEETDSEGELLSFEGGESAHLFSAFTLVNYLQCSATRKDETGHETPAGAATPEMRANCKKHFMSNLHILKPNVIIVQSAGYWASIASELILTTTDGIISTRLSDGTEPTWILPFKHPARSWHSPNCKYWQNTVKPMLRIIREKIGIA